MATIRKRGDSYVLDWSDAQGQHRKSLGEISQREAKIKLKAKEYELASGKRILPTGLIFQNFVVEYKDWHAKAYPSSHFRIAQIIDQHLVPEFGLIPIDQIGIKAVEKWAGERLDEAKRATILKEVRTLVAIINKALDWQDIQYNPLSRLMRNMRDFFKVIDSKPPRFYTTEEMQKIYDASLGRSHWWKFIANEGIRRGEALQLKRADIGTESLRVLSIEDERTKSGKWREIPLFDGGKEALDMFPRDGKYLFPRMNPVSLSRAFANVLRRAGIDGSVHCLRHTFCSHLVMKGWSLRDVKEFAGHAHIQTTEKYVHSGTEPINIRHEKQLTL